MIAGQRMVWLEASVRGVKTLGYEPNPGDLEVLKREREARLVNRIEPARDATFAARRARMEALVAELRERDGRDERPRRRHEPGKGFPVSSCGEEDLGFGGFACACGHPVAPL